MLPQSWHQQHQEFFRRTRTTWNHSQLVEVAAVALREDERAAPGRLRQRLLELGPGYHETVTGCWLELIRLAFRHQLSPEQLARRLSFSQLPFAFYSPARLQCEEAARRHLSPDLKPLALPPELPADWSQTVVAFQSRQLSKEDWTHCCHLRVAAGLFLLLGEPGLHVMSVGIQRLNEAHGVPLTPTGGYHETLTRVWFLLVAGAVESSGLIQQPGSGECLQKVLNGLQDKGLPLRYYSRERLLSWEARIGWVEPDLRPLECVDLVQ